MKTPSEIAMLAVDHYGADHQIQIAIEECSELIQALCHYKRGRCNSTFVSSEIADVLLSIESLKVIFGRDRVSLALDFKRNRLEELINKGE